MLAHFNWDAVDYFRRLVSSNKLAARLGVSFAAVSGLQGFEEALDSMLESTAFVCVSDSSDGRIRLDSSPNSVRIKTVFIAIRHEQNDVEARNAAFDNIRELFRQFMSDLLRQHNRLHTLGIYLDPDIDFHEMRDYTFSGCACAYFHIKASTSFDLRYEPDLWLK